MSFFRNLLGLGHRPVTPQLVQNVWTYLGKVYDTHVIDKSDSTEMALVGTFLSKLGIQDKDIFMKKYTTTIGRSIYTPFTVGVPTADYPLMGQIIVAAHEHQHVVQSSSEGDFSFTMNYLLKPDMRAKYEAEAYRSTIELLWFYHNTIPDLHQLASILLNYGLTQDHVHVAEITFASAVRMIKAGLVLNQATKTVLPLL